MKNSFILYTEQKAVIDKLTDEQAGRLIKAIYAHETGEEMELDSILDLVITPFLTSLERNTEKYQKRVETNKKNIAKRWNEDDTKNTNGKNGIQNDTNDTNGNDSDSDSVSDSDNVNDLKENTKRKVFAKPTVEEVKAYCTERKNNVDANKFIDFYESKGWLIGKNPMKDWKACVRTWEKTSNSSPPKPSNAYINPSQSEYDDLSMFYSN
jgi:hypothetical protein